MSRLVLPNKYVADSGQYQFPFASVLPPGQSIVSASVSSTVYSGVDGSPSSMISGSASFSNSDFIVRQNIIGGVAGAIYVLDAQIGTSSGNAYHLHGYVAVLPAQP